MDLSLQHRPIAPAPAATTAAFVAVAALASWQASRGWNQSLLTAVAAGLLIVLAITRPRLAIFAALAYLAVLGDLRRLVMWSAGQVRSDPLLLVGPAVAAVLAATALMGRRLCIRTPVSRLVMALMVLMAVQVLNPLQGGIFVGVAGAIFHLVPLLWFWIGQAWGSDEMTESLLHRLVVPIATAASLLGIWQVFNGFLPYEQHWIDQAGYAALNIQGRIRPFSFFTSAAEFAHYAAIASLVLGAAILRRAPRLAVVLLPLLAAAVFLQGSRSVVVMAALAAAVMWAVNGRDRRAWLGRMGLAVAVAAGGLVFVLAQAQDSSLPVDVQPLVDHQVRGLMNPLDHQQSTAQVHWQLMVDGFRRGIANPLGYGLGATTLAASKQGSGGSSEVDVSNTFISLGPVGGVLYLLVIYRVLRAAAGRCRGSRCAVTLALLGILVMEMGQWLNGGQYATAALVWFCIGSVDRNSLEEARP